MKDLWNYLKDTNKPIVLYGMGNGADKIISVLNRYGIKLSGVFASDGFVRKKTFHEFDVLPYSMLKRQLGDMIVLLCFGTALPDVIDDINKIASECELYAPNVPVFGDTLFNIEYARAHRADLEFIYNRLADDTSKKVFYNDVMYKLTGKIEYLFDCQTTVSEVYQNVLKFGCNETYFDLGAYRGDTVEEFLSQVNGFNQIIAVEPDRKTYNKLCAYVDGKPNIKCVNAAVCDICGNISFDMHGSRGSSLGTGQGTVTAVTIDALAETHIPTYIKFDVEGAEYKSIMGGAKTITNHRPKMQIATYHRSEDLIQIPKTVLSMCDDYKIYLRHFPCLPDWDTSYFFV
ncbi:MAG: FkbM family methyltransferase [Clostridia bacterium]|nr:FkbM family methyltransferase [Clostridia bacterium]